MSVPDVIAEWDQVAPLFERFARMAGEIRADQVQRGALDSNLQIWGLQDSERVRMVCVTEISETASGNVCTIRVACGTAPKGLQQRVVDEIGKWAKSLDCRAVRIVGRRGWLKRLKQFRQSAIVMEWAL